MAMSDSDDDLGLVGTFGGGGGEDDDDGEHDEDEDQGHTGIYCKQVIFLCVLASQIYNFPTQEKGA